MKGREDVNDDGGAGHHSTSTNDENVDVVKKIIMENSRTAMIELIEHVGISVSLRHAIFSDVWGRKTLRSEVCSEVGNL